MLIYIPSYGRPEKQITFKALPKALQKKVVFVVRESEYSTFKDLYEGSCKEIITHPNPGVADSRHTAVEHSPYDKICFLDDDLRFSTRVPDWDYKTNNRALKSTTEEVGEAIAWLKENLDSYACVGLGARGGNNGIPKRWVNENYRIMRSFAIDRTALQKVGVAFNDFYYWEDFHIALSLLESGRPNAVSTNYVTDGITNAVGGVKRNLKNMWIQARRFVELHPTAKIVEKTFNQGAAGERAIKYPDLQIAWKKTYTGKATK